jgi:exodeoxyribonuclease VII large subunit
VLGEIQNIKYHSTGVYFQLADFKEGASRSATMTVNATLWRSQMSEMERKIGGPALKELLQDGIRVRLLVDVSLYRDRGQISLQVQGIDPSFTKGSLALARERLLRELRAKGVDRQNKSLPLTPFPFHIGLISAPDSRAKSDFLDQLALYNFPGEVTFVAAQMQGEKTLEDVVQGLRNLQTQGCDLIVLTRGGGSAADLRWFDSPEIAYAIAACSLPVIAAIGHHEDVCIAEEICFQREKTPTAAADFILSVFQKTRERLDQLTLGIQKSLRDRSKLQDQRLAMLRERLMYSVQQVLHGYQQQLTSAETQIEMQTQRRLMSRRHELEHLQLGLAQELARRWQQQIYALEQVARTLQTQSERKLFQEKERIFAWERALIQRDPAPWMKEGWTQLIGAKGRLLSIQDLRIGSSLKAPLPDGTLFLTVDRMEPKTPATEA